MSPRCPHPGPAQPLQDTRSLLCGLRTPPPAPAPAVVTAVPVRTPSAPRHPSAWRGLCPAHSMDHQPGRPERVSQDRNLQGPPASGQPVSRCCPGPVSVSSSRRHSHSGPEKGTGGSTQRLDDPFAWNCPGAPGSALTHRETAVVARVHPLPDHGPPASFPRKPAASRLSWEAEGSSGQTPPSPAASRAGGLDGWAVWLAPMHGLADRFLDGQGPGRWTGLLAEWHHGHRPPWPGPSLWPPSHTARGWGWGNPFAAHR